MANKEHNDPLEEFFEKKLQDYDIEYQEEDWLKLEDRLDAIDEHKRVFWKRYAVAAAIVFLFSILAYITYQQQQKINQLNERLTNSESITTPQNNPLEILPHNLFVFPSAGNQSQVDSDETSGNNDELDNLAGNVQNNDSDNATGSDNEISDSRNNQQILGVADLSTSNMMATRNSVSHLPEINKETLNNAARGLSSDKDQEAANNRGVKATESGLPTMVNAENELASRSPSKFTVGILGGPDLSTVGGISNFYDPGHKLGLSVEYAISNNLSLSVGAIHSKVNYTAQGNDYNPPEGYWSYGTVPDETIAQCFIIDIPISLKYNVFHFEHSRLYAGGGISSYIMLNEEYQFKYSGYNNSGQPDRWQERTGTRHWMSNAMVSVGFEQDISKDLSVRIEPFIKVPIREVGWGNVKLYSMGSLFSINYNLY